MATYCFDLDGVITRGKHDHPNYDQCEPNIPVIALLYALFWRGDKIIIFSSRHEEDWNVTIEWLAKYCIPYNELILDKPLADMYIDDRGFRYAGYWEGLWTTLVGAMREEDEEVSH